jgi:hypothetical protein
MWNGQPVKKHPTLKIRFTTTTLSNPGSIPPSSLIDVNSSTSQSQQTQDTLLLMKPSLSQTNMARLPSLGRISQTSRTPSSDGFGLVQSPSSLSIDDSEGPLRLSRTIIALDLEIRTEKSTSLKSE